MIPLTLLTSLPWTKIAKYAAIVLAVLFVLWLPYHYGCTTTASGYETKLAKKDQLIVQMQKDAAEATRKAEQVQRAEEQRRQSVVDEVSQDAANQIAKANVAARDAHTAVVSLRDAFSAYVARRAGQDPGAATGSQAAAGADLSADVFGSLGEEAANLAAIADRARIAGSACEKAYDGVRAGK